MTSTVRLCCGLLALLVFGSHARDAETPRAKTPEPLEATLERGPYLQCATPQSIVIVWRTTGKSTPLVRYGQTTAQLDQTASLKNVRVRVAPHINSEATKLHSAPDWTYQYEATLTALTFSSTYYYAVYDGDTLLAGGETYHFTTHPAPSISKPVRMWVVGDSGMGDKNQASVTTAMQAWIDREKRPLDMFLHVGDMAYNSGRDSEFTKGFFKPYEATLRNVVCWPSMGNHEGSTSRGNLGSGPYYDCYVCPTQAQAGGVPSGTEAYYSFDYGRIHFICLDSHDLKRRPDGAMARWLSTDLEKTNAAWLIAFFHHPPYTKGSHDSDREKRETEMRTYIMPILEAGGVDLVLTGHSHIYERSMLLDGAYATPTVAHNVILDDGDGDPAGDGAYRKSAGLNPNEGDIQVVAGHGGAKLNRKGTMPVMKRVVVEHGSCLIDIDGNTLTAIMVDKKGDRRDTFSLIKEGKVTPKRVANPKQLPPYKAPKDDKKDKKKEATLDDEIDSKPNDKIPALEGSAK